MVLIFIFFFTFIYLLTIKMGQYWKFICVDRREATYHLGKMGEIIHDGTPEWIQGMLVIGKFPMLDLPVKLSKNYKTKAVSPIEKLPYDILFSIFSQIQPKSGILSLAMTCYRMLVPAQQFIRANSNKLMSPWANTRLICCGDYAYDLLPNDMLTAEELTELDGEDLFDRAESYEQPTKSFFNDSSILYREHLWNCQLTIETLLGNNEIIYPSRSKAILRNKTLKVYIRGSKIPVMPQQVCLGVILILQICWSADSSMSLYYQNEGQEKGPWAGHRFDITWSSEVDKSWTDVSDEVVGKLQPLFDAEFSN